MSKKVMYSNGLGSKVPVPIGLSRALYDWMNKTGMTNLAVAKRLPPDRAGKPVTDSMVKNIIYRNCKNTDGIFLAALVDLIGFDENKQHYPTAPVLAKTINGTIHPPQKTLFHTNIEPEPLAQWGHDTSKQHTSRLQENALDIILRLDEKQLVKAVSFLGVIEKAQL